MCRGASICSSHMFEHVRQLCLSCLSGMLAKHATLMPVMCNMAVPSVHAHDRLTPFACPVCAGDQGPGEARESVGVRSSGDDEPAEQRLAAGHRVGAAVLRARPPCAAGLQEYCAHHCRCCPAAFCLRRHQLAHDPVSLPTLCGLTELKHLSGWKICAGHCDHSPNA